MKNTLVIPVLLLLASPSFGDTHYSYAFGKCYIFEITPEMLDKSPSWDEQADNPPLSAGKAIRLATSLKNRLVKDSKDFKWRLISATLDHTWGSGSDAAKKWWWSVRFEARFRGDETGRPNHLEVLVLMDGTVIEPKIEDDR